MEATDVRSRLTMAVLMVVGACRGPAPQSDGASGQAAPESEAPLALNPDMPIAYPPALFDRKVEGDVTLRLFVDSTGKLIPESTRVAEPSGYPALDSPARSHCRRRPRRRSSHPLLRLRLRPRPRRPNRRRQDRVQSCGIQRTAILRARTRPSPLRHRRRRTRRRLARIRVPQHTKPYDNVLETIGWTPLIRLNKVTRGIRTPVY